jgi:shikimate dehydrogenase
MSEDRVFTLADLRNWQFDGTSLAVLGHPVAHSLSPAMHNAALADLAQKDETFASWRYFKFDIDPKDLAKALPRFDQCGFVGLNLTVPHKVIALGLVRQIDPVAAEAGAVNTLRRTKFGYEGFNTDGYGISKGISEDLGVTLAGSPVVLLGAGGAARAAAVACLREGCTSLWIGNRTPANLERLIRDLQLVATQTGTAFTGFSLESPPEGIPPDAIVINATSSGLKPGSRPPIDLKSLGGEPRVYDMIYNPTVTPLLQSASDLGLRAANGISMLVHQGVRALEIWTQAPVSASVMKKACLRG